MRLQTVLATSVALDLGTLIHKSLASWIISPNDDPIGMFMGHSNDRMAECIKEYKNLVGVKPTDAELDPLFEAIDMGLAVITNYKAFHKRPLPRNMVVAAPEQEIIIPIYGTEHPCTNCDSKGYLVDIYFGETELFLCQECNGTGVALHYLKCTFDGLIQNEKGLLFILEHKTYAKRPNMPSLFRNDQFIGYLWGAQQLNIGKIAGLAYDGMLKKRQPTGKEKLADLFIRTVLTRPQFEIDEWGVNLVQVVNEMATMPFEIADPILYPNRRWEGCYDCQVEPICTAISTGENYEQLIKQKYVKRVVADSMGVSEAEVA